MFPYTKVGYVIAGLRSTRQARIGDTMYVPAEWMQSSESIVALEGYEPSKPMLFASVYPVDSTELEALFAAVDRLCLNDSSITVTRDHSVSLGYVVIHAYIQPYLLLASHCCDFFHRLVQCCAVLW